MRGGTALGAPQTALIALLVKWLLPRDRHPAQIVRRVRTRSQLLLLCLASLALMGVLGNPLPATSATFVSPASIQRR